MRQAIALAIKGAWHKDGGAFGALVVRDGKIIVAVYISVKESNDCTQHAELKAIQKACQLIGGGTTFEL